MATASQTTQLGAGQSQLAYGDTGSFSWDQPSGTTTQNFAGGNTSSSSGDSTNVGSSSSPGLLAGLDSILPSASTLTGLAPYAAAAGLGYLQANNANQQNQQYAGQLTALGQPLTQIGSQLAQQALSGTLTPQQQAVVDQSQTQGQQLIDSAAPLAQIANTGFAQYQAGQLQPGQQQQIDASTAAAKQELRQRLGDSGISDSSILAGQDQAIDNQAAQMKATLMAQNLGVADQQFAQWLTTTTAGQQMQQQGKQFAVTSINNMLSQALQFSQAGMQPEEQAVQTAINSNTQLSTQIQQLMSSLMTAYAMQQYQSGKGGAGTAGGVGGSSGGGLLSSIGSLFSGSSAGAADQNARINAGYTGNSITSQYNWDQGLTFTSGFNDGTSGYNLNSDGTVDTATFQNYFYDPSETDMPNIDFGGDTDWEP